jgi:hypothetical protein
MSAPSFVISGSSNTIINLSWTAVTTSAEQGGLANAITNYELYFYDTVSSTWVLETTQLTTTYTKSSGITGGQTYRFKIRAMNKLGT